MKQKLLAVLATFVAVTPFMGVKAAEIQYTLGSEHNFLVNKDQEDIHNNTNLPLETRESVGVKVIALGEEQDGYVRALATGAVSWIYGRPSDQGENSYKELWNYAHMYDDLNGNVEGYTPTYGVETGDKKYFPNFTVAGGKYVKDYNADDKWAEVMTANEFLTWMKGTNSTVASGTTYQLEGAELERFKLWFAYPLDMMKNPAKYEISQADVPVGFYTSTFDKTTNKIWVVNVTIANNEVTGAVLKENTSFNGNNPTDFAENGYITVPILYFNKSYNCKYETSTQTACFKCGDEYQWIEVGKQASTCEAVSSITSKAKCVKPSKTGVEDYILEFAIAAGICGIVLVAVKRKSLFSRV